MTYLTEQVKAFQDRMDLGVMVVKKYLTQPRSPKLESHHQMQLGALTRTDFFFFFFSVGAGGKRAYFSAGVTIQATPTEHLWTW